MPNEKSKKIFDQAYIDDLSDAVSFIIEENLTFEAFKLRHNLEQALAANSKQLKEDIDLDAFYNNIILELSFIALPLLDENDVYSLLKEHLSFYSKINGYNLLDKIRIKSINIIAIEDKNKFKDKVKHILLDNETILTPSGDLKTAKDWMQDYLSHVGLDEVDTLARAQYLSSIKGKKDVNEKQYGILMDIFSIYDFVNQPSDSPAGFDEEPPIMIDGKLYIFNKGALEPVKDEQKMIAKAMELLGEDSSPSEESDGFKDVLSDDESEASSEDTNDTKDNFKDSDDSSPSISELQEALKDYSPDSLEYKAISQELSRLKAGKLREVQKSGR